MRLIDANTLKAEFTGNFKDEYTTAEIHALIDLAPTIGGWISVKDRMPEKPELYLTASDAPAGFPKLIKILMFVKGLHETDPYNFRGNHRPGWVDWDDEYGYYEYDAVTHWMPLPEPPEGE